MVVTWGDLNGNHPTKAFYRKGEDKKRRSLVGGEARAGTDMVFKAYGHPLTMVLS